MILKKIRPYNVPCAEAPLNSDWISMPPLYQGKMLAPAYFFNFCLSDHVDLTNNVEHAMHVAVLIFCTWAVGEVDNENNKILPGSTVINRNGQSFLLCCTVRST